MGDRGIVVFNDGETRFGFYSHWQGSELVALTANILARNPRVLSRLESGLGEL